MMNNKIKIVELPRIVQRSKDGYVIYRLEYVNEFGYIDFYEDFSRLVVEHKFKEMTNE